MHILAIQFDADKGLGLLDDPLRAAGCELDIRLAPDKPISLEGADGLIVLGGLANPDDDDPALTVARGALVDALSQRLPTLGVCLGAELLAGAAGAATPACEPEYGFCEVRLEPAAGGDPVVGELPASFMVFEAHGYECMLPAGALALARSAGSLQAFRLGRCAWGLQFHFEPTVDMLAEWTSSRPVQAALARSGVRRDVILEDAAKYVPAWVGQASAIARGFAGTAAQCRA